VSEQPIQHPCFKEFEPWSGTLPAEVQMNFLGQMNREKYVGKTLSATRPWTSSFPIFDEEYFEWIDLLDSVLKSSEKFTIFELGAGFGRWAVNGAIAARKKGKTYRIVAVEAEPKHFSWLKDNLQVNQIDVSACELYEAAVAAKDDELQCYRGDSTD
jgi:protoporphyrinogen oxidase